MNFAGIPEDRSGRIVELWRLLNVTYVSKARFFKLDLPPGFDHQSLWDAFTSLRRAMGDVFPFKPLLDHSGDDVCWSSLPDDCLRMLRQIATEASNLGELTRIVMAYPVERQLSIQVGEVMAACAKDGVALDRMSAQKALVGQEKPTSNAQTLLRRFRGEYERLENLTNKPIDTEFICGLFYRLTEGLHTPRRPRALKRYNRYDSDIQAHALENAVLLYNSSDRAFHDPIIDWLAVTATFWDNEPLPTCNALVELLLRHVYFRNIGMDALGFVDFTSESIRWEFGRQTHVQDIPSYKDVSCDDCGQGYDATYYNSVALRLVLGCLQHLREQVDALEEKDKRTRRAIHNSPLLNHRQKAIADKALAHPSKPVTIDDVRAEFGVAVSTAACDLHGLCRLGLMHERSEGKRLTCTLSPEGIESFAQNSPSM